MQVKGYYLNGTWHKYGFKLYSTIGQNANGSMTQKAFTNAIKDIVDDIIDNGT